MNDRVGAFKMNPWQFFFDQLSASLTTDLKLLWSQNTTELATWATSFMRLQNYFIDGTKSHENITDDLTKTG